MLATETRADRAVEFLKCVASREYFIDSYCQIKTKADTDAAGALSAWLPFHLWPAQRPVVAAVETGDHLIILKARQLGLTWLILACILWQLLFRPACTALLFSKRETEAWALLTRLKEMYAHLPPWLQSTAGGVQVDSATTWRLGNGSEALAFPTTAGDSYTAQIALCDEFDLVETQDGLLDAVGPTVIESGQLLLLSRVDKDRPLTAFKRLYQAAKAGTLAGWRALFLPWCARPDRDAAWYAARVAESLAKDTTVDSVHEQYPATDAEALAPPTLNKRLPADWLLKCYYEGTPLADDALPALPGLTVYAAPLPGRRYVIGADPAEGNPHSDPSSAHVLDRGTRAECARLTGQIEPTVLGRQLVQLRDYYNQAGILPERNNHGGTVIAEVRRAGVEPLHGPDGRAGWLTTAPAKTAMYDRFAEGLRAGDTTIRSLTTFQQLASIESATLRAPEGQHDDEAVSYLLAYQAAAIPASSGGQSNYLEDPDDRDD